MRLRSLSSAIIGYSLQSMNELKDNKKELAVIGERYQVTISMLALYALLDQGAVALGLNGLKGGSL